jgi:hypothetical protein
VLKSAVLYNVVKATLKMEEIISSETLPLIDQIKMSQSPEENSLLIYNFIDVSEEGTVPCSTSR